MGCCMSHSFFEKETVYEVTLDSNGVAQRVPKGQGTHYIHISPNNETHLEEKRHSDMIQPNIDNDNYNSKSSRWPTLSIPQFYNKHSVNPLQEGDQKNDTTRQKPEMKEQQVRY